MPDKKRDDYFRYTKPEEIEILETQCEKCVNKLANPLVCKKFHNKKPLHVLRCEGECEEFEEKDKK